MDITNKLVAGLACVLLSFLHAFAFEYNDGKVTWSYFPIEGATDEVSLGDGTNACVASSVGGAITIPDTIDGKRVTALSANAFKGCTKVTSVSILENLQEIEEGAFDGATSLKAFGTLNRNENFFSFQGSLYMGDWEGAELVRVPPALEADEFTGLVKPQVWYVYPGAFNGCASIQKIQVNGASAEALYECSFVGCAAFTEFVWVGEYWDDWSEYCVKDGVLYCGDYELVKWPTAKPLESFESMVLSEYGDFNVADGAFAGNPMERITIPAWTWVGSYAFEGCANLREIDFLGYGDWSGGVLYDLEDAGINLKKVIYPGFPKGMAEDWEGFFDQLKEEYGGIYSNIVYEKTADPNLGKTNITIPYTERWDLCWKYDFEAYAKDLTTLTFEGPCPDEFLEILEICSNVTTVVYSANPIYRDANYEWESWKSVMSWDWASKLPGRTLTFQEGAIPSGTQFYFEDPECCDGLYGIWYYDEAQSCNVCLSPIWPAVGELKIPNGVYELGEGAFCGLDQVTKLVLPQTMAWDGCIDENIGFETMSSLAEIEVEGDVLYWEDSPAIWSEKGCLYCDGQLFRVPPAYASNEFVIDGWDYPYWNALSGCRNIKKLTAGNLDMIGAILWDLDLTGCDQLVEFDFKKWACEDAGYRCIDGAIYEDWGDGELCLLLWPNAKRPIEFAPGTVEVDCEAFRYVKDPGAVTEVTVPSGCWLDFWCLAKDYGFTGITKLVFEGEADIGSDIVEVLSGLQEIVYSPSPFYAENWECIKDDFEGTGVKFTAAEPSEPLYGYELEVWEEDDYGNILDGECYLGYEGYPFVYPALKGAYEIPEKIENCRVVWAAENAFANMSDLTELKFPRDFYGFDESGSYREGYWDGGVKGAGEFVVTGEVDIVYSPFVGCTSLAKLTFNGACPEGLREVLEVTPSIREVYYNDSPWYGESGWIWSEFIAEFKAEHPESPVKFVALPTPEEPLWNIDSEGWLCGEYYPEDGIRIPCVWPDLVGEAEVPDGVYGIGENAFACMSNLTALTFPRRLGSFDAGTYREGCYDTNTWEWVTTGEVDIVYSPFVGCTSLAKLTFNGACPEGLREVLEVTPSIREVYYNDSPWYGESGWIWSEFIAEFKAEHPESPVKFVALPTPEEPLWNIDSEGWLGGEYYPEDGIRIPCVWPDLVGEAEVPDRVYYIGENAFACMSNLTALTIPASVVDLDAGTYREGYYDTNTWTWVVTGEVDIAYSPFVGCESLAKLTFNGTCPAGLWEVLELTPSIREVYYNDFPWYGESGLIWRDFIAQFKLEHPGATVSFVAFPGPDETIWNVDLDGWLSGEFYPEAGIRIPCVWPDLVGEATVPSNVCHIGENAFACMSNLTALTIPASVEDVADTAFVGCASLKKLVFQSGHVPDGVWELLELTPSIEEVVVPSWWYRVGGCEEEYNEWLDWFVMDYKAEHPDSTIVFKRDDGTEIGGWEEYVPWKVEGDTMTVDWWAELDEGVFDGYDLSGVTKLVLPPYLDYVGDGVFGALTNLCEVEAIFTSDGDEATYFGSKFGEGQRLKLTIKPEIWWECDCELCESEDEGLCPICKSDDEWGDCDENCGCPGHWEIEDFAIQSEQFENAEWIETLVIEEPAFAIGDYAFAGCVNLKSVTIPASVEWMGEGVFAYCEKLEKVSYGGNAPYGCVGLYNGASSNLVSYVKYGTTGWTGVDGEAGMPSPALWPVWEEGDVTARPVEYVKITETGYAIVYLPNGGAGEMDYQVCARDNVYNLTKCAFKKTGKAFKGWAGSNGKRYDDGVLIFNAAAEGKVLTLTAIWE